MELTLPPRKKRAIVGDSKLQVHKKLFWKNVLSGPPSLSLYHFEAAEQMILVFHLDQAHFEKSLIGLVTSPILFMAFLCIHPILENLLSSDLINDSALLST